MNIEGRLLHQIENATGISLEGYPNGTYIAVVYDKNGRRLKEEKITKPGE